MRSRFFAAGLACLSFTVAAESAHSVKLINDTHTRIVSFAVAPVGDDRWTKVDFHDPLFENQEAVMVEIRGGEACRYDFRTTLSDGRSILIHNFNICRYHAYRPGVRFYYGHPGGAVLP